MHRLGWAVSDICWAAVESKFAWKLAVAVAGMVLAAPAVRAQSKFDVASIKLCKSEEAGGGKRGSGGRTRAG
jgi:hypothetical protein